MSVLNRLASAQSRREQALNQELARELAETQDRESIREIVETLSVRDRRVQGDCVKVLYEIGYIAPELIADHAADFLRLLGSKNNRLVWGGMIALSTIAPLKPEELYGSVASIMEAVSGGSVITADAGVGALSAMAAGDDERREAILPFLFEHLSTCAAKDMTSRAEQVLGAIDAAHQEQFVAILQARLPELTPAQQRRVRRVIGKAGQPTKPIPH